jgi:glucokinase
MSFTVGIDVGGTKVLGGVVDEAGVIHKIARRDTPKAGGAELIAAIAAVANELRQDFPIEAVGVSAAGFVSSDRKTILATPNIAGWNGVNLDYELTTLIGLPVDIENDANSAAWAEARFGSGQGKSEILMLTVGTGIGGGVITGGKLHRGAFGLAAEIGHMRVVPDGLLCGCGGLGCFEQYASGSALMRYTQEELAAQPEAGRELLARGDGTLKGLTGAAITASAQDGDPIALSAFRRTADWLGAGIASLSVILDPESVIIGGGVIAAGEILLAPTRESLDRNMPFAGKHPHPEIIAASLGNNAGLVGVADLARR